MLPIMLLVCRVGQNHIYTVHIYGIFGRKITKNTVTYGVYIRIWPTLIMLVRLGLQQCSGEKEKVLPWNKRGFDSALVEKKVYTPQSFQREESARN